MRPPKTPLEPGLPMWAQPITTEEYTYRTAQSSLRQLWIMRNRDECQPSTYTSMRRWYLKKASDALNVWRKEFWQEYQDRQDEMTYDFTPEELERTC